MGEHLSILLALGTSIMVMAWLPSLSKKIHISYPIILLFIGFLLFWLEIPLQWPDPLWPHNWTMTFAEIIVVISLMTAGLKIDWNFTKKNWKIILRLIAITMPLTIVGVYFIGTELLGLSIPLAVLLAAVMSPTDPVLASEVQLKDTYIDQEKVRQDISKFSLTAEAGLNDGMAFPFTFLGVLLIQNGGAENFNWWGWFLDEFLLKVSIGAIAGFLITYLLLKLHQYLLKVFGIKTWDGLLAFSMAIVVYSLTEIFYGYGFLAVFVASVTMRNSYSMQDVYKKKMHDFVDEIERLLVVVWIIIFGGSILNGIFEHTNQTSIWAALLLLLVIRPLSGMLGLAGSKLTNREKLLVSFFGVRGIGSIFYLSWASVYLGGFEGEKELYAIVLYIVLFSIVIHGLSAPFSFFKLDSDE